MNDFTQEILEESYLSFAANTPSDLCQRMALSIIVEIIYDCDNNKVNMLNGTDDRKLVDDKYGWKNGMLIAGKNMIKTRLWQQLVGAITWGLGTNCSHTFMVASLVPRSNQSTLLLLSPWYRADQATRIC